MLKLEGILCEFDILAVAHLLWRACDLLEMRGICGILASLHVACLKLVKLGEDKRWRKAKEQTALVETAESLNRREAGWKEEFMQTL